VNIASHRYINHYIKIGFQQLTHANKAIARDIIPMSRFFNLLLIQLGVCATFIILVFMSEGVTIISYTDRK